MDVRLAGRASAIGGSRGVIEFLWGDKGLNLTPAHVNMLPENFPAAKSRR